jgi:hypothetical protein
LLQDLANPDHRIPNPDIIVFPYLTFILVFCNFSIILQQQSVHEFPIREEASMKTNRPERHAKAILQFLAIGFLVLQFSCEIDHGLEPIRSKIGGVVSFKGDKNPDLTDEVRVALVKKFPPKEINELLFSEIILNNSDRLPVNPRPWEIYVSPGSYEIAAVIWKANNQSWNISDVIGIYGGSIVGDQVIPPFPFKPIVIPESGAIIDTINIETNLNKVNRDATVEGKITFVGQWPSNTGIVAIGAFIDIPAQGNILDYLLKNVALDYSVPINVDQAEYRLRIRSTDALKYMAVIWIADSFDFNTVRDIGYFRDPADTSKPGIVTPKPGATTGIDIFVDFSRFGGG